MKLLKYMFIGIAAIILAVACEEGIDPITPVEPGPDEEAPSVTIQYPTENTRLQVPEEVTPITIEFEVTDDIEIGTISVELNDNEIAGYNEFKDYRRFVEELLYENVTNGEHTLTITATDIDGKTTTESVTFEKASPYTPKYAGEIFYMPFDGSYMEMISFETPTVVGNPGFAGEGVVGGNAYEGALESYLTFPAEDLTSDEFSAVFWMNVNADPGRAGILVMSPEDPANPEEANNRQNGLRFFREGNETRQTFKLNVGLGDGESWFDGGDAASIDPTATEWVHLAFTISPTEAVVYLNGQVASRDELAGIDWTGVDLLSIMSGAPRFVGWDHLSDLSYMDELRLFNKALSQQEIQNIIAVESGEAPAYQPEYNEIFYMPFDGEYVDLVSHSEATVIGNPEFSDDAVEGQAYSGAAESYLTFPADVLHNDQLSATFWMKINPDPDRAGILVAGPPDTENAEYPDVQNNRTSGFRFLREAAGENQIFKLNVGTGDADTWFDGGEAAQVDPTTGWTHFAFTISEEGAVVYIDGQEVSRGELAGIDWTNTDILSIMSGAPRFNEWNHLADLSLMDELRFFDRILTQEEIEGMIADDRE